MTASVPETDVAPVPTPALVADTTAKTALYSRVSRAAAAERDSRVAIGAAWAADVLVVQMLLLERAPDEPEEAQRRLAAVATAIGTAVGGSDDPLNPVELVQPRDAREVVVHARRRLLSVFDGPAAALIADRLPDLEHLAELPPGTGRAGPSQGDSLRGRAHEIGSPALVELLRTTAADGRAIADALLTATYRRDAARQACLADVAEVEAYLVEASVAAGDHDLLLADVRRAALVLLVSEAADRPVDVAAARAGVWAAVRAALPSTEVERLAPRLGRHAANQNAGDGVA